MRSRRDAGDRFRLNAQPLVGFGTTPPNRRYQRLQHALRRRRRLRNGLIQLLYMVPAVGLAFLMSAIDAGPDVDGGQVISLFFSLAGGLIAFIALIFSLLFLVVPYANTTLTPRLTLFRDDPVVWHSFAFLAALFVFLSTTGMVLNHDDEISFVLPVTALVLVLVSLGMVRALQFRAYRSLQLGGTLADITAAGQRVLETLYGDVRGGTSPDRSELPPITAEVRWPNELQILRQIDLPRLLRVASDRGDVIEVRVGVGQELRRDVVLFAVRGSAGEEDYRDLVRTIETGPDRTFDQDPLFAFRLLADIALRALSPAVNDPFTAVQAIGGIHQLLHDVMARDLDIGHVGDDDNELRVVLTVPSCDDYLAAGVDELVPYLRPNPLALVRLAEMVDALLAGAPPTRRAGLEARRQTIAALSSTGPI